MKALRIKHHGPADQAAISEVARPVVGPGQLLVQVVAAGVNPSDKVSVEGKFPHAVLPRIIGRDFAGRVVEGPRAWHGRGVFGSGGDLGITRDGTFAEFIALPVDAVVERPEKLTLVEAAAVGVPYVTAWSALEAGRLEAGQWVLISGAAGAVGQAATVLALARGAHVVALIRDASSLDPRVKAIAHADKGDLQEVVKQATRGRGCDVALNGVGASIFPDLQASMAEHGRIVVYSAVGGKEAPLNLFDMYRQSVSVIGINTADLNSAACAAILRRIVPLLDHAPKVDQTFALDDVAKAFAFSGKAVLQP